MPIIDLTDDYQSKYLREKNREEYENSFPELFRHYYRFWTQKEFDIAIVTSDEIQTRKIWIGRQIEKTSDLLTKMGIDSSAIDYVYFIGVGTSNGHAFKYKDRFCVWLPLETYPTERLISVFVTHEIAHALHYHSSPAFYFDSKDEQIRLSRQLISEGLATYLTKELLGVSDLEALWSGYLSEDDARKWWQKCQDDTPNLFRLIRGNFSKVNRELEIFFANNPEDIHQFRSGYYAGLRLIEKYAQQNRLSVKQLLELPRDKFEKGIFNLI